MAHPGWTRNGLWIYLGFPTAASQYVGHGQLGVHTNDVTPPCRADAWNSRGWHVNKNDYRDINEASIYWLVVSTHLKNISQNGNLPQIGVNPKNIWNHHLVYLYRDSTPISTSPKYAKPWIRCAHIRHLFGSDFLVSPYVGLLSNQQCCRRSRANDQTTSSKGQWCFPTIEAIGTQPWEHKPRAVFRCILVQL